MRSGTFLFKKQYVNCVKCRLAMSFINRLIDIPELWSINPINRFNRLLGKIFAIIRLIITGSIARSANLPVFSLLRGRF